MESADYMGSTPFVRDVFKSLVALVERLEKSDYDAFLGDLQKRSRF